LGGKETELTVACKGLSCLQLSALSVGDSQQIRYVEDLDVSISKLIQDVFYLIVAEWALSDASFGARIDNQMFITAIHFS